jgi:hypothetical protein
MNRKNINYKNKEGFTPLMSLLNLPINNLDNILDDIIENNILDHNIKDNIGLNIIDHLIVNGYFYHAMDILSANNIKIMEYLSKINKNIMVDLIGSNSEIYDMILMNDKINMRDYLEYVTNDVLELGLIKKQIDPKELSKYKINYKNISKNKILLKEVLHTNSIELIENIILKNNHLLDYINLDVIEMYYKKNNRSILEYIIDNCNDQKQIINILKKILSREKICNDLTNEIWSKLVENEYDVLITYLIKIGMKPTNSEEIIEKIDLHLFDEKTLNVIFCNIRDNKLLLKYLLKDSKFENIILGYAKQSELTDNCIICYGKESDRQYYYKCEHAHNYHFDCLIPYLKKHNMIDMKCFFCKGNMCFNEIYKN